MKVAIVGGDAILRHKITETIKADQESNVLTLPLADLEIGIFDEFKFIKSPERWNQLPADPEKWPGKGKQKMRRQR